MAIPPAARREALGATAAGAQLRERIAHWHRWGTSTTAHPLDAAALAIAGPAAGRARPAHSAMDDGRMSDDQIVARARRMWVELLGGAARFSDGEVTPVLAQGAALAPWGWAGVVEVAGSVIASAPDERVARMVREGLAKAGVAELGAVFPEARVLGPVALAYLDEAEFRPVAAGEWAVEQLPGSDPALRRLEEAAGEDDTQEAGLFEIGSPAFVVRVDGEVVAAAGYQVWAGRGAHLSVLTAPAWRGRGLVRVTGTAATAHALGAGLLPQWRARVPASRRAAVALGYREIGSQLAIDLG
ncbi:GNAT family N-acetyltransferase [Kitasatospora sp. NPDC006697]|uniref:GNAT family N-acetyltransferase n=1 Tax=Kitasatospora sp. NPDC006697 TaxID=3364020 RepID=UPI0036B685AC